MRKVLLLIGAIILLVTLWAEAQEPDTFRVTALVKHEESTYFGDIQTFNLTLPDATVIVVMGDGDLPIIKQLIKLDKKKIILTLTEARLEQLHKEQ